VHHGEDKGIVVNSELISYRSHQNSHNPSLESKLLAMVLGDHWFNGANRWINGCYKTRGNMRAMVPGRCWRERSALTKAKRNFEALTARRGLRESTFLAWILQQRCWNRPRFLVGLHQATGDVHHWQTFICNTTTASFGMIFGISQRIWRRQKHSKFNVNTTATKWWLLF